jgi:periplasmic copper chaperone A
MEIAMSEMAHLLLLARPMLLTRLILLGFIVVAGCISPVVAQEIKAGDLQIEHPWSRATPGGAQVAAGYLVITNKGSAPDRLIGGTSPVAGKVEVHEMAMKDKVMTMRRVPGGLPIGAGKSVTLAPGGYHIMFEDLKAPLKEGTKFAATLEFEKAGKVDVTFDVQGVGAQAPMPGGSGHDMSGQSGHKM